MISSYFSYLYNYTVKSYNSAFESFLEYNEDTFLLDCGCWDGDNTKKFGSIIGSNHLYGIEIDKSKAKEASKKGIKVRICNLNNELPYKNNFFDVIIANHVIEHLVNTKLFVSEMYRILKTGGYVIIGTPNLASWHNIFALFIGLQPFSGPTIKPDYESDIKFVMGLNKARMKRVFSKESGTLDHIKVMTAKALIGLLKDFKFRIEGFKGFGYYPFPPFLAKPLLRIDPYHSHYIIVKARK